MERKIECSVLGGLCLEKAVTDDYKWLYRYHYRTPHTGPVAGVWVFRHGEKHGISTPNWPLGVIVYGFPSANLAARPALLDYNLACTDNRTRLIELNRRLRTIRRVIIEPRWRGLGLAARLVRQTLPLIDSQWVEACALMGRYGSFFEQAGMRACVPPERQEAAALKKALLECKIPESLWHDSRAVFRRLSKLNANDAARLEKRLAAFLTPYKNRRAMPSTEDRLRFVLSRLGARPAYYLWHNPVFENRRDRSAA